MDEYEKVKVVGRGAFGTVYLCRRKADRKEVVIKQIPIEQLSAIDRQAAVNEVKVLAMLHHPNVIEYHDSFVDSNMDKSMSIVMEYASGGNLYEYLEARAQMGQDDDRRYLAEEDIAHLLAQIVAPLHLVHSRQVLHRDLKTQNIFLTRNHDHVKIGDFGISKILSSKSKAYSVVGTPCYISPELCEGKAYNQKSDVWALGCVLYEMCTLRRAFEAPTLPALVLKIMRGTFNPLPADRYSDGLRQLLSMMLALEPGDRPTMGQIMAHHWLCPYVYRLATSLGALPCTARPPRPLSSTVESRDDEPAFGLLRSPMLQSSKRSVSPFMAKSESRVIVWRSSRDREPTRLRLPSSSPQVSAACAASQNRIVGVTAVEGKAVEWNFVGGRWGGPSSVEGLTGITIVKVASSEGGGFVCMLTDRGILLTYGRGSGGCLGHGEPVPDRLSRPRIVEALLGDEVVDVSCGRRHAVAVTSEGEVFGWGRKTCFGGGGENGGEPTSAAPAKIELEDGVEATGVSCGWEGTVLVSSDGAVWAAGKNSADRFGRGKGGKTRRRHKSFKF